MNEFDEYLRKVMKGTFLRSSEKTAWLEEMQSHLEDAVEDYKIAGLSDEQAREKALRSFGEAKQIRHQIVRETFVVSPRWYVLGAMLCLLAAVAALFTTMRFDDVIVTAGSPATWKPIANPLYVLWLHRYLPLNVDRWVALGVMSYMMVFARKRTDRLAVLISWIPFEGQMFITSWRSNRFQINSISQYAQGIEIVLVTALALGLYLWSRNQMVSLTPWVILVAISALSFAWHLIQETLWVWTGNPVFWGLSPVTWVYVLFTVSSIIFQVLLAVAFVKSMRKMDSYRNNRRKVV